MTMRHPSWAASINEDAQTTGCAYRGREPVVKHHLHIVLPTRSACPGVRLPVSDPILKQSPLKKEERGLYDPDGERRQHFDQPAPVRASGNQIGAMRVMGSATTLFLWVTTPLSRRAGFLALEAMHKLRPDLPSFSPRANLGSLGLLLVRAATGHGSDAPAARGYPRLRGYPFESA